jgi:aspartate/methionine/tyrosine aminotransferase
LKWHKDIPDNGVGMGIADIDFKGPNGLVSFLLKNLKDDYSSYGPFEGMKSVIEIGKHFLESNSVLNVHPEQIQIIPGTMIGIYAIMEWISRKPGKVTIINPIYPPIYRHASQTGNKIDWVDLNINNNWRLDHESLKGKVGRHTKLIVFNNPNNPTGTVYKKDDLQLIADLAQEFKIPCFVDELYYPLIFNENFIHFGSLGLEEGFISLHGFSKSYGFAGWRSGFMHISHPEFKEIKYIIEQLIVSPSPVTSLTMAYALTSSIVKSWQKSFQARIFENVKRAVDLFTQGGIECVVPEGGFFVFPKINVDDGKFKEYLLKKFGIEVVAGSEFGPAGKRFIRVNCATSQERVELGINKIIEALDLFTHK